jgi:hypothetical protein
MAKKVRKQIYIEPRHELLLKHLMRETGMSEAELIRQALDRREGLMPFPRDQRAWQEELAFIAQLMEKGSAPGKRSWKREELHER